MNFDDIKIAKKYINKAETSKSRNIEFLLSFNEFKELCNEEYCYYTGIKLTTSNGNIKLTDRTLERVDCSKPYSKENTVAVCNFANNLKSFWENKEGFTEHHVIKMLYSINQHKKNNE